MGNQFPALRSARVSSSWLAAAIAMLIATGGAGLAAAEDPAAADNPLLTESKLPYHLQPFALIKDEQFAPAFDIGMSQHLAEIDAIAGNKAAPTFDNTIVAMERSGRPLARVRTTFNI